LRSATLQAARSHTNWRRQVNDEASVKVLEVEMQYNQRRRPVYQKRNSLIRNIEDFWQNVFEQVRRRVDVGAPLVAVPAHTLSCRPMLHALAARTSALSDSPGVRGAQHTFLNGCVRGRDAEALAFLEEVRAPHSRPAACRRRACLP